MTLEPVFDDIFVGLLADFRGNTLRCRPAWANNGDAFADAAYGLHNAVKFQDWSTWAPLSRKRGLVTSLISRCVFLSLSDVDLLESTTECLLILLFTAHFPLGFVQSVVSSWCNKCSNHQQGRIVRSALSQAFDLLASQMV